jgi:hypothetical protein
VSDSGRDQAARTPLPPRDAELTGEMTQVISR